MRRLLDWVVKFMYYTQTIMTRLQIFQVISRCFFVIQVPTVTKVARALLFFSSPEPNILELGQVCQCRDPLAQ